MNTLYMAYFVLFCLFALPSNYVLKEYGSRASVCIGTFMMALGAVIKCGIYYGFGYCIFGAIIAGCGLPFIWNAPAQVAVEWFGVNERTGVIAFFIICQYIGGASGFLLPTFFVNGKDTKEEFMAGLLNMTAVTAIACATLLLLTFVLFKAKPGNEIREPQWNVLLDYDPNQPPTEQAQDLGIKDTFR
jgi:MFS family permease